MTLRDPTTPSKLFHRKLGVELPAVASASGIYIRLKGGGEIIDASCGSAVSCIGHSHPRVVAALREQIGRLDFAYSGTYSVEPAEELADLLVESGKGAFSRVIYVGSGSEAMEASIKLARQYHVERGEPQRTHVIARRQSYHGATFGALSSGGHMMRRRIYEDMLPVSFSHVSPCYAYRGQGEDETVDAYTDRLAKELEDEITRVGEDKAIAFCAEPVVGAALGCVPAEAGYFKKIRSVCDRYGVLLILDEVMCGMGRSGTLHAWEQEGIRPDIQATAKGLAAGYVPLGAVLVSPKVVNAVLEGSGILNHGQTFQAHPLACRAGLEVQRVMQEDKLVEQGKGLGELLESRLKDVFGEHPHVGDIRGRGLFWALEFVKNRHTKECFPLEEGIADRVGKAAFEHGMAIYPGVGTSDGETGDHVIIAPPFTASDSEIEMIVERLKLAVTDILGG
ncbi:MAG: aspartate aminotransferase family protein [Hyphomonadaceae bacterium TMED5]|nr:aspartate aminotransferase family protein [Ponticaulis sp.]OUX96703.1 MAG: aspartate aminotransferase family protein [Hyphomonadaceae bacterium TMED5]